MVESITNENLHAFHEQFRSQTLYTAAMRTVTHNGLLASAQNVEEQEQMPCEFSIHLEQGEITAQNRSGRCWMFAALNTFRVEVMRKLKLETFELSQAYLFFYDKLEKANYFLESILETLDETPDGRLLSFLLQNLLNDGGQWDMLCNLVEKYGVVPKNVMPDAKSAMESREMNSILTKKVREYACVLRKAYREGSSAEELRERKETMLSEFYRILCICLGKPPKQFDFEIRNKDKEFHRDCGCTPQEFYKKYVGLNLRDYVSLIHAPTEDKPFHKSYSVRFLGNVKEGNPVRYLNLEIEELKKAAIAQLKDGRPVWFGCDVGQSSCRENGLLDLDAYKVDELLQVEFGMNKAERLEYGESMMTHAMVFQGVNLLEDGTPNRWKVENSWGTDSGVKGYYIMSDAWFDQFVYQVVVHKKYLPDAFLREYEAAPTMLEPWDPMGSLAVI